MIQSAEKRERSTISANLILSTVHYVPKRGLFKTWIAWQGEHLSEKFFFFCSVMWTVGCRILRGGILPAERFIGLGKQYSEECRVHFNTLDSLLCAQWLIWVELVAKMRETAGAGRGQLYCRVTLHRCVLPSVTVLFSEVHFCECLVLRIVIPICNYSHGYWRISVAQYTK